MRCPKRTGGRSVVIATSMRHVTSSWTCSVYGPQANATSGMLSLVNCSSDWVCYISRRRSSHL